MADKATTTKQQQKVKGRGRNPNTLANIQKKSWKKGQSGNPKGRPKGSKDRATIVKKWLTAEVDIENPLTGKDQKISVEDAMVLAMAQAAIEDKNVAAYNSLKDELYGKLKDSHESTGELLLKVLYGDDGANSDNDANGNQNQTA